MSHKCTLILPFCTQIFVLYYISSILMACLTHWGRVTHICVSKLIIIGSDNGLLPDRRQAIIWTNDGILWIGPLGTNFSGILFAIYKFSLKKMRLNMSSGKWRPSCLGPNVLTHLLQDKMAAKLEMITCKCNFVYGNCLILIFFKVCSLGCNWIKVIIGLVNGNKPLCKPMVTHFSYVHMQH